MSELQHTAERFLCNQERSEFRELITGPCHDFDGREVVTATYRVVSREEIVRRFGEGIVPLIPVLKAGTWEPGPELLGLKP